MSAGQHEAVQVDVDPSEFVDEDDLADVGERTGQGQSQGTSRSSFFEMLQSTEPSESPEMQDGTFSTGAAWHQHLELGVKKATGAAGTPAWLNLSMAAILAVVQGVDPTATSDEQDTGTDADLGGGNVEVA
jgi:hypothetical protein